jgi:hypothetical protein
MLLAGRLTTRAPVGTATFAVHVYDSTMCGQHNRLKVTDPTDFSANPLLFSAV